jgi:predicted RNA binding protein YcfA (HicA-like mRNA interferase family)
MAVGQGEARVCRATKDRWQLKRQTGSHRKLWREGSPDFVFAFHDGEEIGPRMLARIAKHTGLQPGDL